MKKILFAAACLPGLASAPALAQEGGSYAPGGGGGSGTVSPGAIGYIGVYTGATTIGGVAAVPVTDRQVALATDTLLTTDQGGLVEYQYSSGGVAISVPTASGSSGSFPNGFAVSVECQGSAAGCTFTPASGAINGASSLTLYKGQGATLVSQSGNWDVHGTLALNASQLGGLGSGVGTALGVAANAGGGVALVNGTPTSGNCLKWSSSGIQDAGAACGSGGGGGIVRDAIYGLGLSNYHAFSFTMSVSTGSTSATVSSCTNISTILSETSNQAALLDSFTNGSLANVPVAGSTYISACSSTTATLSAAASANSSGSYPAMAWNGKALTIAAGSATDSTNAATITLSSSMTKLTSATWTAASGNGVLGNGVTVPTNGSLHVCAVQSGATNDVYFDSSATCANPPSSLTSPFVRRIGSVPTDGNGNFLPFIQSLSGLGHHMQFGYPIEEINSTGVGSGVYQVSQALKCAPVGVPVMVRLKVLGSTSNGDWLVTNNGFPGFGPTGASGTFPIPDVNAGWNRSASVVDVWTDSSAKILLNAAIANANLYLECSGFMDPVGLGQ